MLFCTCKNSEEGGGAFFSLDLRVDPETAPGWGGLGMFPSDWHSHASGGCHASALRLVVMGQPIDCRRSLFSGAAGEASPEELDFGIGNSNVKGAGDRGDIGVDGDLKN